jgi:PQQ-like domain
VTNEEQRLTEALHRLTPEPPRRVSVEQVAYRMGREPGTGREPRPRRGVFSRAWAPAAAAVAVVVVAGAGVGIAALASSHHGSPPAVAAGAAPSSTSAAASATASASRATAQALPGTPIAGGPWDAELIDHQTFTQDSLVSSGSSLYAYGNGTLDRIDPATGTIAASVRYSAPLVNLPVIVGNTVWVVYSYGGGNVVLHGYDAQTLAQTSSLLVPAIGHVAASASSVLAAGSDGHLYVAAGDTVAIVNPSNGQIIQRIYLTAGTASSVAVSPDGSKLYVGIGSFKLLVYDVSSATEVMSSTLADTDSGGNLVATAGGVWGTTGTGQSQWTWFAPGGNLAQAVKVGPGAGGGLASYPSYNNGVVWIGGSGNVVCASASTGQVLAKATVPTDHSVVEYFGSPVVSGDHAYAYYTDNDSNTSGLARMTPPAACSGLSS